MIEKEEEEEDTKKGSESGLSDLFVRQKRRYTATQLVVHIGLATAFLEVAAGVYYVPTVPLNAIPQSKK